MKKMLFAVSTALALNLISGCQKAEKIESAQTPPKLESKQEMKPASASTNVTATNTAAAEKKPMSNTNEVAVIKTSLGEMVVEFWSDVAPKTVDNFKKLARDGFYDGTAFHRIIKGFMAQGGDPLTKDPSKEEMWGTGDPGYKIDAEFSDRQHVRGVLSMARSRDPNSAGCQFFICLGTAPHLDRQYTAFGKVIKGDDVLGKIADTPVVASRSGEPSKPTTRVGVESIKIVPADSVK